HTYRLITSLVFTVFFEICIRISNQKIMVALTYTEWKNHIPWLIIYFMKHHYELEKSELKGGKDISIFLKENSISNRDYIKKLLIILHKQVRYTSPSNRNGDIYKRTSV